MNYDKHLRGNNICLQERIRETLSGMKKCHHCGILTQIVVNYFLTSDIGRTYISLNV